MDQELKIKWLEALRSGNYEQGISRLKDSDTYCCLGVLCEIQGVDLEEVLVECEHADDVEYGELEFPQLEDTGGLTYEQMTHLAAMNDGLKGFAKHDFVQIADYIEANL